MENNIVQQRHENSELTKITGWGNSNEQGSGMEKSPFNPISTQSEIILPHIRQKEESDHSLGRSYEDIFHMEGISNGVLNHQYHSVQGALQSSVESSPTESLEQLPITKDNAASIFRQRNVYQDQSPQKRQKKMPNSNHDMEMINILQQNTHHQFSNDLQSNNEVSKRETQLKKTFKQTHSYA